MNTGASGGAGGEHSTFGPVALCECDYPCIEGSASFLTSTNSLIAVFFRQLSVERPPLLTVTPSSSWILAISRKVQARNTFRGPLSSGLRCRLLTSVLICAPCFHIPRIPRGWSQALLLVFLLVRIPTALQYLPLFGHRIVFDVLGCSRGSGGRCPISPTE